MADVEIQLDMGGVRAALRSGEVQGELQRAVDAMAARADATAHAVASRAELKGLRDRTLYRGIVDDGRYTALGKVVMTGGKVTQEVESRHHVLSSINH